MAAKKSPLAVAIDEAIKALQNLARVADQGGESAADDAGEKYDRAEIEGLPIKELRELAAELELDEQKVKKGILDEMEANGLFADSEEEDEDEEEFEDEDEADEEDDEDEEEEDEEDEDEEEGFDREELEGMTLVQLKKLAKEEGHDASVYRKLDQDALIDLLMGEDEDGEDEEEDEESEEEIDEDTLRSYDLAQLKKVAAELDLKVPVAVAKNKTKLVNFILENAGEEDDE